MAMMTAVVLSMMPLHGTFFVLSGLSVDIFFYNNHTFDGQACPLKAVYFFNLLPETYLEEGDSSFNYEPFNKPFPKAKRNHSASLTEAGGIMGGHSSANPIVVLLQAPRTVGVPRYSDGCRGFHR